MGKVKDEGGIINDEYEEKANEQNRICQDC